MPLNIKDPESERLAAEIAAITGESKTRAVRTSLQERRERLSFRGTQRDRREDLIRFLEQEVWPSVPPRFLGKRVSRKEKEKILGYGMKAV